MNRTATRLARMRRRLAERQERSRSRVTGAEAATSGPAPVALNLGCGRAIVNDYVNADVRPLPGVNVVCDVRRLPFATG